MYTARTTSSKKWLSFSFFAGICLAIASATGQLAFAQAPEPISAQDSDLPDQVAITVMPDREGDDGSLILKPGEKQQIQVRVRNSSDKPLRINSKAYDFLVGDDGKTPIPVTSDVSGRWSLASWLTMVPSSQVIAPYETVAINILIETPANALPGGHYAMVVHSPSNEPLTLVDSADALTSDTSINMQPGTLLYAIVDGPINEEAFVRDFTAPNFSEFGPVPFSYTVENTSDIHIKPQTHIEIYDIFGRKVDTVQVEPRNVFPLMNREFTEEEGAVWNQVWGYGLYTAKLVMSYGTQGQIAMTQTTFWLLPLKLILAILIILLALIAVIISVRRHILHRRQQDQERIDALESKIKQYEGDNPLDKYED